jgi:GntR family histidine utilization transcriptional repressor
MTRASWQDVRNEVLRRIRSREWPAGGSIPNEAALSAEFGCARATVNRALRELARDGLIERRRRAGSAVRAMPVRQATFAIPVIRQDVESRGMAHGYRLASCRRAIPPAGIGAALGRDADKTALHVVGLHLADGAPFAVEDRWLNPEALGADFDPAVFETLSANEWLVQHVPATRGRIAFDARAANAEQAALLGCAQGTALLCLGRQTWSGAVAVTVLDLAYAPGHRIETGF